jgi:hypothetical protein
MAGYDLVEPGVVPLNEWRPDDDAPVNDVPSSALSLVGRLPG